jgi:chromosomal replication initiator protein
MDFDSALVFPGFLSAESLCRNAACDLAERPKKRYNSGSRIAAFLRSFGTCRLDGPNVIDGVITIPLGGRNPGTNPGAKAAALPLGEFIAGPENRLLAYALRLCMEQPDATCSPLVLYGVNGAGKSHIVLGLIDWWSQHRPAAPARLVPAAEFAREYAAAQKQHRLEEWRRSLESLALVVIEDVGQLAGKAAAQQELLQLLDALADREALVIVTARSLPSHAPALSVALRSRLGGGLAVHVSLPGAQTRREIVQRLAQARGLQVSHRALRGLADSWAANVPMLASAVAELELASRIKGEPADARHAGQLVGRRKTAKTALREIATLVAKYFGLSLADLRSPKRRQPLVAGRGVAMYLARQLTDKSYQEIGAYFGGRDHTTVLHGCRRTASLVARDRVTRQAVNDLTRLLHAS